ncbi:MAG: aldo/keto reductase [Clostridia bacterium]|nr:aldo/keto reductase [Clostridia bacterium]
MKYSEIQGLDKKVSLMVFGTATPALFAAVSRKAGAEEKATAFALLDEVYAAGMNTFDCAAHYGEQIMGEWMEQRGNREDCVIISKCAHPNNWRHRVNDFDILSDAHDSLKKLKTDCIDIYMLHRDNVETPVSEIVDVMNRLKDEGKIKIYGGSNWTHERIEEANEYAAKHGLEPMRVSSPNFGLAEQIADPWLADAHFGGGCITISGPENKSAREWYAKNGVPVFAYSSLARGFFSGAFGSDEKERAKEILDNPGIIGYYCDNNFERLKRCEILAAKHGVSVAQMAMAWIFNQKFRVYAISSPVTPEFIKANVAAMDIELSDEETAYLALERD